MLSGSRSRAWAAARAFKGSVAASTGVAPIGALAIELESSTANSD